MFLKEVLKKCNEEGYPITSVGLYNAGKKYGFITKSSNGRTYDFDAKKFLNWLEKSKEKAPEGWITLNEAHTKFNIGLSTIYMIVNENKDSDCIKRFGPKEVIYVNSEGFKRIITERKNRHTINWEEE